jgi:hypothetical protein
MKRKTLRFGRGFRVALRNDRVEAAEILRTLNLYVPPAYDSKGGDLPAGRR